MEHLVIAAKTSAVDGMEYFLRNFSFVPDDRLNWSPTPTSKSPIRIAAHTALYAGRFARMIRERQLPGGDGFPEWYANCMAEEIALTSRAEMETVFREGTADVLMALDTLTQEDMALVLDAGMGFTLPMTRIMTFPGWHCTLHGGQIDFLQTCWDDQEVHF